MMLDQGLSSLVTQTHSCQLGDHRDSRINTPAMKSELKAHWLGKTLHDVPTPSVVLDLAKLEANCDRMLQVVQRLSLSWRPHIKTHKVGNTQE